MSITIRCECGAKIRAGQSREGEWINCPKCEAPLMVSEVQMPQDRVGSTVDEDDLPESASPTEEFSEEELALRKIALFPTPGLEHPEVQVVEVLPMITAERVVDARGTASAEEALQQIVRDLKNGLRRQAIEAEAEVVLSVSLSVNALGAPNAPMFYGVATGCPALIECERTGILSDTLPD